MEERKRDTLEAGTMRNSPLPFTLLLPLNLEPWFVITNSHLTPLKTSIYFYLNLMIHFQVCLCTNPIWLVKTRLQLQTPLHQTPPYSGLLGL